MTLPADQVRAVSLLLKVVAAQERVIDALETTTPELDGTIHEHDARKLASARAAMAAARRAAGLDEAAR